jgi:hypothetical protein
MPFLVYQGQNNDITVLHRSPIFDRLATSEALEVKCKISKHDYDIVYYLADVKVPFAGNTCLDVT